MPVDYEDGTKKPPDISCKHIDKANPAGICSIYEDRPSGCKGFMCAWLEGHGDLNDKPDRIKVVFEETGISGPIAEMTVFLVGETEPGAIKRNHKAIFRLCQKGKSIVTSIDGETTWGAEDDLRAFSNFWDHVRRHGAVLNFDDCTQKIEPGFTL